MKLNFEPKTKLEKFALKVYFSLVENFSRTYLVGGTVRDLLLDKKIQDIDIATSAKPNEVANCLKKFFIDTNLGYIQYGVILAVEGKMSIAIASFRKDLPSFSRYPKIKFVDSAKVDSFRRDFTVNSLYFSPKTKKIIDYHSGLKDLKNKKLRFIGKAKKRIQEDPLRIIRALRFCLSLSFKLEKNTKKSIRDNFFLVENLSESRIKTEIQKLQNIKQRQILENALSKRELLDKYF